MTTNKKFYFVPELITSILTGEKTTAWRLFDDQDFKEGDVVDFYDNASNKLFATAKLTRVVEKTIGGITDEDEVGHEKFDSEEDMYQKYERYYGREVGPETPIKVIWFELIR
jgi:hypothetical protein